MNIEKRGKAKRVRKPAPKTAPKQEAEPPKPAEPEPAPAAVPKAPEICKHYFSHLSSFSFDILLALPTIETPPIINTDDDELRVPTIQSTIDAPLSYLIESIFILADESGYEDEGPRRQKPAEKVKRVSQSKLDVISETLSSKCPMHDKHFFSMITHRRSQTKGT